METSRNEFLWRKARKRASFKRHLQNYLIVNAGFWAIYAISFFQPMGHHLHHLTFPWPIWPMFGWGIGLVSHYFAAYGNTNQLRSTEIEYEKLIREQR
ncbi:2TM domain-containing protein [Dyadobacter subterraneus]|uniref:2TM domain-containing protein n=1 Tax=Dyadobacter subterraneus TaxID=2773304 RepID=A0ABR9WFP0_9BACT|nr:2TM domain-containing protein [Dyadobacter subterraneus]MBE9464208.1 2TM domain-containing protein [Dyadobacter subterraneus]